MENIIEFLQTANPDYVKLFFVEREKDEETREIAYRSLKTVISSEIGREIVESTFKYVSRALNKDPEFFEYGIIPNSDRNHVEMITTKEVPYFNRLIEQISDPNAPAFSRINNKVIGYIIKIRNGNKTLLLFKKYSPQKILEKGKLFFLLDADGFEKLNQNITTLDEKIDALTLIENGKDYSDSTVFILNRSKFESFFSFVDFYIEEIENKRLSLVNQRLLDNEDQLVEICIKNSIMTKKFARILKSGACNKMSAEQIKSIKENFDLDVDIDESGKLKVCDDKVWTILRILDDDHLHSQATDGKYEARSKVKR